MNARVCVIGGGVLGLSTAAALLQRGVVDVTVIEAEHPGAGVSSLSFGVVGSQYLEALDIELRARSLEILERFETDRALPFAHIGYLRLGHDPALVAEFEKSVELQAAYGRTESRVLASEEIGRLVPDLYREDVVAGMFGPRDGYTDGYVLCRVYTEIIRELGGNVLRGHRLLGAHESAASENVLTTNRGEIVADIVVNAAGAEARWVGTQLDAEVPVDPVRHYAAVVHTGRPLRYVMPLVMDYVHGWGGSRLNFRHESEEQLFAELMVDGLGNYDDEATGDHDAASAFQEALAGALLDRLPGLDQAAFGAVWSGPYPESPDGRPILGPHPARRSVHSVVGAGGYGIQLAPVLGEVAAEWITEGQPLSIPAVAAFGAEGRVGAGSEATAATPPGVDEHA